MKFRIIATLLLAVLAACSTRAADRPDPRPALSPTATRATAVTTARASATPVKARPVARPSRRDVRVDPARLAAAVVADVNRARRRAGLRPLRHDPGLARAAERYARELASRGRIDHVSRTPGRRTFRQRIAAEGVRARIAGENLARLTADISTLPERAVEAWMRSPGHRANMLDPVYARTGVGVWLGADGVWYIVQEFATAD